MHDATPVGTFMKCFSRSFPLSLMNLWFMVLKPSAELGILNVVYAFSARNTCSYLMTANALSITRAKYREYYLIHATQTVRGPDLCIHIVH